MYFYSKNLLRSFAIAIYLLSLLSCTEKEKPIDSPRGTLELNFGVTLAVHDVYSTLKAANPDDFTVAIYTSGGELYLSYDNSSEMPEQIDLPIGEYYAEAHSENDLPAAFENDYYFGRSENFEILAGQTQSVTLNCSLANIRVTVVYSQAVVDEFSDYTTTVSNSGGSLVFSSDETRAGFFDDGPLNIETNLYYPDGTGGSAVKSLLHTIDDAEQGKHYEIQIDASVGGGEALIDLNVDESYETEIVSVNEDLVEGPIANGDLLITEIMYNPAGLSDTEGEYIEIVNNTTEEINLNQVVLVRVAGDDRHTINEDIIVAAGEYIVLARSLTATDNVDYSYGSAITLPNSGETIQLANYGSDGTDGSIICSVNYGAANFNTGLNGVSLQLSNGITSASAAADGLNWCVSTTSYSTGDLGSPGQANTVCP